MLVGYSIAGELPLQKSAFTEANSFNVNAYVDLHETIRDCGPICSFIACCYYAFTAYWDGPHARGNTNGYRDTVHDGNAYAINGYTQIDENGFFNDDIQFVCIRFLTNGETEPFGGGGTHYASNQWAQAYSNFQRVQVTSPGYVGWNENHQEAVFGNYYYSPPWILSENCVPKETTQGTHDPIELHAGGGGNGFAQSYPGGYYAYSETHDFFGNFNYGYTVGATATELGEITTTTTDVDCDQGSYVTIETSIPNRTLVGGNTTGGGGAHVGGTSGATTFSVDAGFDYGICIPYTTTKKYLVNGFYQNTTTTQTIDDSLVATNSAQTELVTVIDFTREIITTTIPEEWGTDLPLVCSTYVTLTLDPNYVVEPPSDYPYNLLYNTMYFLSKGEVAYVINAEAGAEGFLTDLADRYEEDFTLFGADAFGVEVQGAIIGAPVVQTAGTSVETYEADYVNYLDSYFTHIPTANIAFIGTWSTLPGTSSVFPSENSTYEASFNLVTYTPGYPNFTLKYSTVEGTGVTKSPIDDPISENVGGYTPISTTTTIRQGTYSSMLYDGVSYSGTEYYNNFTGYTNSYQTCIFYEPGTGNPNVEGGGCTNGAGAYNAGGYVRTVLTAEVVGLNYIPNANSYTSVFHPMLTGGIAQFNAEGHMSDLQGGYAAINGFVSNNPNVPPGLFTTAVVNFLYSKISQATNGAISSIVPNNTYGYLFNVEGLGPFYSEWWATNVRLHYSIKSTNTSRTSHPNDRVTLDVSSYYTTYLTRTYTTNDFGDTTTSTYAQQKKNIGTYVVDLITERALDVMSGTQQYNINDDWYGGNPGVPNENVWVIRPGNRVKRYKTYNALGGQTASYTTILYVSENEDIPTSALVREQGAEGDVNYPYIAYASVQPIFFGGGVANYNIVSAFMTSVTVGGNGDPPES